MLDFSKFTTRYKSILKNPPMQLRVLDNPKYFKFIIIILSVVNMAISILHIGTKRQTVKLEKELARINRELHLKQIIHDK